MKSHKVDQGHLVVLAKGEQLVEQLTGFCSQNNIQSAWISGIGSVLEAEIAYYDVVKKQYLAKGLKETLEIVSLIGNITVVDEELWPHLHVVLSDPEMQTYGGHLEKAVVGGTCEVLIQALGAKLTRQLDDQTGLKLIQ